jgi:hypothetical protein
MDRRYPEPSGRGLNPVLRAPLLEAIERLGTPRAAVE